MWLLETELGISQCVANQGPVWRFNLNAASIMRKIMNLANFLVDAPTHPAGHYSGNNQSKTWSC